MREICSRDTGLHSYPSFTLLYHSSEDTSCVAHINLNRLLVTTCSNTLKRNLHLYVDSLLKMIGVISQRPEMETGSERATCWLCFWWNFKGANPSHLQMHKALGLVSFHPVHWLNSDSHRPWLPRLEQPQGGCAQAQIAFFSFSHSQVWATGKFNPMPRCLSQHADSLPCPTTSTVVIRWLELLEVVTFVSWRSKYLQVLRAELSRVRWWLTRPQPHPEMSLRCRSRFRECQVWCCVVFLEFELLGQELFVSHLRRQISDNISLMQVGFKSSGFSWLWDLPLFAEGRLIQKSLEFR